MRKDEAFYKRFKSFMVSAGIFCSLGIQYGFIKNILLTVPSEYQWIVALFLPLVRQVNVWAVFKFASKSTNGDIGSLRITCNYDVGLAHSMYLTILVGSIATNLTTAVILSLDFLINIYIIIKIISRKKNNLRDLEESIELLQDLVVNELIEFLVPLVYTASFAVAYYGPNSNLIGNIGNDYWQYQAVEDISHTVSHISLFFSDRLL